MITKDDLHKLISDSKREHSFEEEYVADIVQVGTEYCNSCTWGGHEHPVYHPVNEVIMGKTTRTEVEYDYQKLRLAINESTRNLEQLVVLQEVALENQGTDEFNEYKVAYHKHLRNVNNQYPQLIGNLVSTILNNTQIPVQKKQEFIVDAMDTLDVGSNEKSLLYEPPHTRERSKHCDLNDFPLETREPLRAFLKEYTPDFEFNSSSYFCRLWMSENPERISDIVAMIGSYAKQNPVMIGKLLNPENGAHCFDERDFLQGAFSYVKDGVQALKFDSEQIMNSKGQYNTRLWCKLNAEKALDLVVDSLLKSGKLSNASGLSSWEGLPEICEPLKNGLEGKDDSRFARSLLNSWDKYEDSMADLVSFNPSIGIVNRPRFEFSQQRPESVFERLKDSAKECAPWFFGIGGALSLGLGAAYCILASNTGEPKESKIITGAGVLSWLFFGGFFGGALGGGIGTICADLIDKIPLPRTSIQKEYDDAIKSYESAYKQRVDDWKSEAAQKIKQHYQQQVAI